MIRFVARINMFGTKHLRVPYPVYPSGHFWCSFNIDGQLISCNVVYLGNDKIMKSNKWYPGQIELPYGEMFMPFTPKPVDALFHHSIHLGQLYHLNGGGEIFGNCILNKVKEIIWGDFDVNKRPPNTEGYYTYL